MPSRAASRAPARRASSGPAPVSMSVSGTLRRQYLLVRPPAFIANAAVGHGGSWQGNLRDLQDDRHGMASGRGVGRGL